MKKRILSCFLTLCVMLTMLPSVAFAAGESLYYTWADMQSAITRQGSYTLMLDAAPSADELTPVTVKSGVELTITSNVTGGVTLSGATQTLFTVERGGQLTLDNVTISGNQGEHGAVYVQYGGLLDLGVFDASSPVAPIITSNTSDGTTARNLVVAEGATVRLNAQPRGNIGVSYDGDVTATHPIKVMDSGNFKIRGTQSTNVSNETNIVSDSSKAKIQYSYGHLLLSNSKYKILDWNAGYYWDHYRSEGEGGLGYDYAVYQALTERVFPNNSADIEHYKGTFEKPVHLTEKQLAELPSYDMVIIEYPLVTLNEEEEEKLNEYLNDGGRVYIQMENPNTIESRQQFINCAKDIAQKLHADFTIDNRYFVKTGEPVTINKSGKAGVLTANIPEHVSWMAAYIRIDRESDNVTWLLRGKVSQDDTLTSDIAVDQTAGLKNGASWGSLTILGDGGYFQMENYDLNMLSVGNNLLKNLTVNSRANRLSAAVGVNPNSPIEITGTTAYTLTFKGVHGMTYTVTQCNAAGNTSGFTKISDDQIEEIGTSGVFRVKGLTKGTYYKIADDSVLNYAIGRTSRVDAKQIAETFYPDGKTETNGKTDKTEKAWNDKVTVIVGDDGNYKVTLTDDIKGTVTIPDTWGSVEIDLGGHTIKGTDADADHEAQPGLIIKGSGDGEGTKLVISNGTISGGSGSKEHPTGAPGIEAVDSPTASGITAGDRANITGGNGATDENGNGGAGGAGISGPLTPTVDGGTVSGGNGGDGENGGNGGSGGAGISTDKPVAVVDGKVNGGNGGAGGSTADGDKAGNGGAGGAGVSTNDKTTVDKDGEISGGKGGDGGKADNGTGGNGGNGGSGSTGTTENSGSVTGGDGGSGGPNKGNGGNGGDAGNVSNKDDGSNSGGNGGAGSSDGQGGNGGSGSTTGKTNYGSLTAETTTVTVVAPKTGSKYKIFDENGKELTDVDVTVITAAGGDLTFEGLQPGTTYTVKVVDENGSEIAEVGKITTKTTSSGGHHSSSSITNISYVIKASAGTGGSIAPNGTVSVAKGASKSFTITVNDGYEIADVLVDGKSIGIKDSYTFTNVSASHTIEVKFRKTNPQIVTDPEITGVADWLETDDHVVYLHGYPDSSFRPQNQMTRAEVAQMFYNLLLDQNVATTVKFSDVADDAWYAEAVNALASIGVIKGVGNDQFAPDRSITRAEFGAIATRFAKQDDSGVVNFTDVKTSDWFYSSVRTAVSYGWLNGYTDGTFRPLNTITRTEVTAIVNRMLARAGDTAYAHDHGDVMKHFTDVNDSFWGYADIIEATNKHDYAKTDGVESWK